MCGLSATRPLELTSSSLKGEGKEKVKGANKYHNPKIRGKSAREGQSETERHTIAQEGEGEGEGEKRGE
jgi:hypothetical protein